MADRADDLWFSANADQQAQAKAICAGCPVKQECWNLAVNGKEQWGVWGGQLFPHEYRAAQRVALEGRRLTGLDNLAETA